MIRLILTAACLISIVHAQELPRFDNPNDQIVVHKGYTLSYNEGCEQPNWVKYQVKATDLEGDAERKNNFKADPKVKTGSASPNDYKKSGYDRGHLAPAASFKHSQDEMDESFYMSNMSPQAPGFNRGVWKRLEEWERNVAIEQDSVWVISGAILSNQLETIGENKDVCVPELYYKIVYKKDKPYVFILKNEKSKEKLYTFRQTMEVLEGMAGIKFYHNEH
jgi:endonuclease G